MFKVGQIYKVVEPQGCGIHLEKRVEVVEVLGYDRATARGEENKNYYGLHSLMVNDGSLELINPFSHLYKKESEDLYTIGALHIHLDDPRSFLLQNLNDPAFRIYYDELENVLAVLLDIYENKVVKK